MLTDLIDPFIVSPFLETFSLTVIGISVLGILWIAATGFPSRVTRPWQHLYGVSEVIASYAFAFLIAWTFAPLAYNVLLYPSLAYPTIANLIYNLEQDSPYQTFLRVSAVVAVFLDVPFLALRFYQRTRSLRNDVRVSHGTFAVFLVLFFFLSGWLGTHLLPWLEDQIIVSLLSKGGETYQIAGLYLQRLLLLVVGLSCFGAMIVFSAYAGRLGTALRIHPYELFAAGLAFILTQILVQTALFEVTDTRLTVFTFLNSLALLSILLMFFLAFRRRHVQLHS